VEKLRKFLGPWSPAILLLATLVLRDSDWAKVLLGRLFPPEHSFGGMIVPVWPIKPVTTPDAAPSHISVLLIQQDNGPSPLTDLLCAGCGGAVRIAAGTSSSPPPRLIAVSDNATGSSRVLQVPLPQDELLAVVVSESTGNAAPAIDRFSYGTESLSRKFGQDLTIRTRNGERTLRFFYLFVLSLGGACAMHSYRRAPRLEYPSRSEVKPNPVQTDGR
jgi:hypothetical protein